MGASGRWLGGDGPEAEEGYPEMAGIGADDYAAGRAFIFYFWLGCGSGGGRDGVRARSW